MQHRNSCYKSDTIKTISQLKDSEEIFNLVTQHSLNTAATSMSSEDTIDTETNLIEPDVAVVTFAIQRCRDLGKTKTAKHLFSFVQSEYPQLIDNYLLNSMIDCLCNIQNKNNKNLKYAFNLFEFYDRQIFEEKKYDKSLIGSNIFVGLIKGCINNRQFKMVDKIYKEYIDPFDDDNQMFENFTKYSHLALSLDVKIHSVMIESYIKQGEFGQALSYFENKIVQVDENRPMIVNNYLFSLLISGCCQDDNSTRSKKSKNKNKNKTNNKNENPTENTKNAEKNENAEISGNFDTVDENNNVEIAESIFMDACDLLYPKLPNIAVINALLKVYAKYGKIEDCYNLIQFLNEMNIDDYDDNKGQSLMLINHNNHGFYRTWFLKRFQCDENKFSNQDIEISKPNNISYSTLLQCLTNFDKNFGQNKDFLMQISGHDPGKKNKDASGDDQFETNRGFWLLVDGMYGLANDINGLIIDKVVLATLFHVCGGSLIKYGKFIEPNLAKLAFFDEENDNKYQIEYNSVICNNMLMSVIDYYKWVYFKEKEQQQKNEKFQDNEDNKVTFRMIQEWLHNNQELQMFLTSFASKHEKHVNKGKLRRTMNSFWLKPGAGPPQFA